MSRKIDFNIPALGAADAAIELGHTDDGAPPTFYEIPRFSNGDGIPGLISNSVVNNRGRITFLQDGEINFHLHRDITITAISPANSGADSIFVLFMVLVDGETGETESWSDRIKFGSASTFDYTAPMEIVSQGNIPVKAGDYMTSNIAFKTAIDPRTQTGTPEQRAAATQRINARFFFAEPISFLDEFISIRYETKEVADFTGDTGAPELNLNLFKTVVAPEYKDEGDSTINEFAAAALDEVSQKAFGKFFQRAWANLTAHLIFVSKRDSEITGILDGVKIGQIDKRYLNPDRMGQDPQYLISKYGKEFLRLRRQIVRGPIFLTSGDFPRPQPQ